MKNFSNYISKETMKNLSNYIQEKLVINKDYNGYLYYPKTPDELRKIIEQRYKERGPGTKNEPINFNDIDVNKITLFYDTKNHVGIFEKTKFEYIDVSDWDVSNAKDISFMFYDCKMLTSVGDLSNWNVSKVEDIRYMFYNCQQLKSVGDLSKWNVSNVKDMSWMFVGCKEEIIPDWYKNRK